jgi:microcystin-dependent protein
MTIEVASYISELDSANPSRNDFLSEGDDHIRLIKSVLLATLTNGDAAYDLAAIARNVVPIGTIIMYYDDNVPEGWALCDGTTHDRSDSADPANPDQITTPDLRGRFIMAHYPNSSDPTQIHGYTGGARYMYVGATNDNGVHTHTGSISSAGSHSHNGACGNHALTIGEMPAHNHGGGNHNHSLSAAKHNHNMYTPGGSEVGNVHTSDSNITTSSSGTIISTQGSGNVHTHSIVSDGSHSHSASLNSSGLHSHIITFDVRPSYYVLTFMMKI